MLHRPLEVMLCKREVWVQQQQQEGLVQQQQQRGSRQKASVLALVGR
jgi:hypothetical protein